MLYEGIARGPMVRVYRYADADGHVERLKPNPQFHALYPLAKPVGHYPRPAVFGIGKDHDELLPPVPGNDVVDPNAVF